MEVFAVHAVRPTELRPTEFICPTQEQAERYAAERSSDPGVLGVGVTRFVLGEKGTRHVVALYVEGIKQQAPYVSDDRRIFTNSAQL